MKTIHSIIFIFIALFFNSYVTSQEIVESSFFKSNQELGGDVVINKSIITTKNNSLHKTFEIESPTSTVYYLSAWVKGGTLDNQKDNKFIGYDLLINNELQHQKFVPEKSSWHSCNYKDDVSKLLLKVKLNQGLNTITFVSDGFMAPLIDFVRLAQNEADRNISEVKFNNFVNEIQSNILNRKLNPVPHKDTLIALKNGITYNNPWANYNHSIGATYKYTYYVGISKMAQQQLSISTSSNNFDHVVELFSRNHPELYSWVTVSTNGSTSLNVTIPYTDMYYLRIRSYYQNEQDYVDVQINSLNYTDCVASGWAGFRCEHTPTRELNYFTCNTTGDTRLWIEKDGGVPGKIIGYNDDYDGSGDFNWGTDSRVKNQFSDDVAAILCSAFSSSTPTGTYDMYMKCRNANERILQGFYYLTDIFTQLEADDAIESAPDTTLYNCVSWAGGISEFKEWPLDPGSDFYIAGDSLGSFDAFFASRGYTRSGATSSNASIALWKNGSEFTHTSVTGLANNHPHGYAWESKVGDWQRFFHPRDALGGTGAYGSIAYYYKKDETKSSALYDFDGMMLKEAIEKGIAIIADAKYSNQELTKIKKTINQMPKYTTKKFNSLYANWLNTIKEPKFAIHSNPNILKRNDTYKKLLAFCKTEENIQYLIIDKLPSDQYSLILLKDLAYESNKNLMDEVKEENKAKLKSSSGAIIVNSPQTNFIKFAKKLIESKLTLKAKNDLLGLDNIKSSFQIYPNPATEKAIIKYLLLKDSEVNITVIDITGKEVINIISKKQSKGYHITNVNLSGIEEGVYFCRFTFDNENIVQKLIIQ